MPAISESNATVLVTGANGFFGTHLVGVLLQKGCNVRAVVRSKEKGVHLLKLYDSFDDKLKLVEIPDFSKPGAFDQALQGVHVVFHPASPMGLNSKEPKDMIEPAVNNVLCILQGALKSSSLKRFVFTSSCLAVLNTPKDYITVSEKNWNDAAVRECEEKGKDTDPLMIYAASKTLAEKAAWKFVEDHKSDITWDLSVIVPPWIFGPVIHDCPTLESLRYLSTRMWYDAVVKGEYAFGSAPTSSPGHAWVDCRDLAVAHVRAMEVSAAGGERIITFAGLFVWQDFNNVAYSLSPSPYSLSPVAQGTPEVSPLQRWVTFDTNKAQTILGMQFRTMEETTKDMLTQFQRNGW